MAASRRVLRLSNRARDHPCTKASANSAVRPTFVHVVLYIIGAPSFFWRCKTPWESTRRGLSSATTASWPAESTWKGEMACGGRGGVVVAVPCSWAREMYLLQRGNLTIKLDDICRVRRFCRESVCGCRYSCTTPLGHARRKRSRTCVWFAVIPPCKYKIMPENYVKPF